MSQTVLRQATRLTRPESRIVDEPASGSNHSAHVKRAIQILQPYRWSGIIVFIFNFLAIIPLASMLGYATEEIALRFGETIGGLLNATFGNADGLIRVVQASLLGSILSNLLLVLGFCFLLGGFKFSEQSFNLTAAQNYASLLALSCLSLLIPAAFWLTLTNHEKADQAVLRLTHAHLYEAGNEEKASTVALSSHHSEAANASRPSDDENSHGASISNHQDVNLETHTKEEEEEEEEDDTEYATLTMPFSVVALVAVTVLVAFHAEMLVSSIEAITKGGALSDTFVGLILLPIVGNAAEHMTAVTTAMKNKMDLAIGVALGSSMQIALLVTPLLVIIGWAIGQPMTLFFHGFETVVMFVSVLITNYLSWMARATGLKVPCY
ncbi:Sodium/calcium exchanger protein-domain-containing protein [Syncephalis plumigaleata]|nr:Sodium/calcium exchanger protein-domain-containing protein [Syncephalis plumigaleata]